MKLFSTTRPLKLKLEESMKKIEQLEEQAKADKTEIDRIKRVRFELLFKCINIKTLKLLFKWLDLRRWQEKLQHKLFGLSKALLWAHGYQISTSDR